MKESFYRPYVKDRNRNLKKRTQQIAKNCGLRVDQMQTKIYETGLVVYEKNNIIDDKRGTL